MGGRTVLAAVAATLAAVLTCAALPADAAAADRVTADVGATGWVRPVPGAVRRPFVAPRSTYGPGHRGADLVAAPGTPVVAAHAGTVSFAGSVAGSLHVVVDHGGGLRTSVSFLARVDVRRGQRVVSGQVLGAAGGTGPDHEVGVVHFGLRVGETSVDPMQLFVPLDLAAVVRLVPAHHAEQEGLRSPAGEARTLAESLSLPRGIPGLEPEPEPDWWDRAVGAAGSFFSGWIRVGAVLATPSVLATRFVLAHTPLGAALSDARAMASRFAAYVHSRSDCTSPADAGPGPGGGGSGHRLMAVGGINSRTDRRTGHTFGLDTKALGYHVDETEWFSYAPDGAAYAPSDTWGDLVVKAYALRDQLRTMQHDQPGREVDLIAHSQGGVLVDVFMQLVYDPADSLLPPLGTVVTLSSPHRGAPAASIAAEIGSSPQGKAILERAESLAGGALPPSGGRSTRQLAEDSGLMRKVWRKPLPEQMDLTSVGADDDVVVPAGQTEAPGARHVMTDPDGIGDHSAIVDDPAAMREVRLALEQRSPSCVGWLEGVRGAVEPVLIRRAELTLGHTIARATRIPVPLPGQPVGLG